MKITILNGNDDAQNTALEEYLAQLAAQLTAAEHEVQAFALREMDIKYCIGCFGCWVKTPGRCIARDESDAVCRAVINSDFVLWAAPLRMGFPSAVLKKMLDKSIPLIHPYFAVEQGEAHHRPRYQHYPRFGLLIQQEPDTDADDLRIVADIFSRTALNMKSHLTFAETLERPVADVAHAITAGGDTRVPAASGLAPIPGTRVAPPARLTVFNGSPRGPKGNTPILLAQVVKGFTAGGTRTAETHHLAQRSKLAQQVEAFAEAEAVLLGFPLYTDAMPGIVKAFVEALEPLRSRGANPPLGFLVQSGFPESTHSRHVERYLEKLAARLGSPYLGAIVKGGCEGVHVMPEKMNRKLFDKLIAIGKTLGETGSLDPAQLRDLAKPERYPAYMVPVFKVLVKLPLLSFYWNNQLKENDAFDRRFDRPYVE